MIKYCWDDWVAQLGFATGGLGRRDRPVYTERSECARRGGEATASEVQSA